MENVAQTGLAKQEPAEVPGFPPLVQTAENDNESKCQSGTGIGRPRWGRGGAKGTVGGRNREKRKKNGHDSHVVACSDVENTGSLK